MSQDQGESQSSPSIENRLIDALSLESEQEQPQEAIPEEAAQDDAEVIEEQVEVDGETEDGEESDPEGDEELDDQEVEAKAEAEQEEVDPSAVVFTLEEGGYSTDVTAEEAKLGYMRQKDYTQKTQQLGQQRQETQESQNQYGAALSILAQEANAEAQRFSNVNWEHLAMNDQEAYRQTKGAYNQAMQKQQVYQARTSELMEAVKKSDQAQSQAMAQDSITKLKGRIPNWNNQLYSDVRDYAVNNCSMSKEEVDNLADWRYIEPIYKAMQFDRGKQVATQKKAKPSASQHFKRSANTAKSSAATQKQKQAQNRLSKGKSKNERMGGAIDLLAERFGG
jgi:hypothetical protein